MNGYERRPFMALTEAAGDLLAALKGLGWTDETLRKCYDNCRKSGLYVDGTHSSQCDAARDAIAKAEGK